MPERKSKMPELVDAVDLGSAIQSNRKA